MESNEKNKVVVIIGAGRTGSSMLTKILLALGMEGSKEYVPASEQNPEGFFEDKKILAIHKEIFEKIGRHLYLPLPDNFLQTYKLSSYIEKLKELLIENINSTKTIWGFKDPRTASILPLWSRVFNPLKVVPKYVVTVRNPSSAVISANRQYNDSFEISELVWLVRTCDALYYSGGDCFIVHYEDWFTEKSTRLAMDLINFIGLSRNYKQEKVHKILSGIVKKNLNRSGYERYEVKNPYIKKLYSELQKCSGEQFDHEKLMAVVLECRQAIKSFSFWTTLPVNKQNNLKLTVERDKQQEEKKVLKENNLKLTVERDKQQEEKKVLKENNLKLTIERDKQQEEKRVLKENNLNLTIERDKQQEEKRVLKENNLNLTIERDKQLETNTDLKISNEKLLLQSSEYLKEIIDKNDEIENLKIKRSNNKSTGNEQIEKLTENNKQIRNKLEKLTKNNKRMINKLEKENFGLKTSASFSIGQVFVNAIAKPGVNTILLPYNFLKITLEYIFVRKNL